MALNFIGTLDDHKGWVTSLQVNERRPDLLVSGSRDKTLIVWQIDVSDNSLKGRAIRRLTGHNHFISDVALSSDGNHALSASWDKTLRLWDINTGETKRRFEGHTKDVLSVSFSPNENRQILTSSRDRTVKLWNTLGECKQTYTNKGHTHWVSCVRFSPNRESNLFLTVGWDNTLKIWDNSTQKIKSTQYGHNDYINALTISPDGSLAATGGKDGYIFLWTLNGQEQKIKTDDVVNALAFSPNRYWLCAATAKSIKVYDLEKTAGSNEIDTLRDENSSGTKSAFPPEPISLTWSADGMTLFSGWTDSKIRVYRISPNLA